MENKGLLEKDIPKEDGNTYKVCAHRKFKQVKIDTSSNLTLMFAVLA
jgi:hypothetical protein